MFKGIAISFLFIICSSAGADDVQVRQGVFQLTSFGGPEVNIDQIRHGIEKLFDHTANCPAPGAPECPNAQGFQQRAFKAFAFHSHLRDLVEDRRAQGPVPYIDRITGWGLLDSFDRHDFEFPSVIQRPFNHPSNKVQGSYFAPHRLEGCPAHFPTMVVVHSSIDNREEAEMRMARIITGLTQSMGVLVVHLPDYGPRRIRNGDFLADGRKFNAWDLNSDFLNPDLGELKENIAQAVLDIHAAMDWAQTLPSVDPDRVFLAGMSLGGMLQIIYAGMDPRPSIVAQAIFVGGGDLAGIMEHSFHKNPNEPTAILWRKKGLPETEIREQLLEVDPILWAHRIHNQDIYWINSEHDYLMLRDSNYGKVHSEFAADNDMSERWNDTTHAAEGENGIYVVTHIVLPIANFGASHSPAPPPYNCHSRHR